MVTRRVVVSCDSCKAETFSVRGVVTLKEARRRSYAAGWRQPGAGVRDFCPRCVERIEGTYAATGDRLDWKGSV